MSVWELIELMWIYICVCMHVYCVCVRVCVHLYVLNKAEIHNYYYYIKYTRKSLRCRSASHPNNETALGQRSPRSREREMIWSSAVTLQPLLESGMLRLSWTSSWCMSVNEIVAVDVVERASVDHARTKIWLPRAGGKCSNDKQNKEKSPRMMFTHGARQNH